MGEKKEAIVVHSTMFLGLLRATNITIKMKSTSLSQSHLTTNFFLDPNAPHTSKKEFM